MSLFGNDHYQWRETYFVLFKDADRPQADAVVKLLSEQDDRFAVSDVNADENGRLESLTLRSPEDSSAMDITYVSGEEVLEQTEEILNALSSSTLTPDDRDKMNFIGECDSRFDIFHFEEVSADGSEEEEILDPGALLLVMEQLAAACHGVGVDPQSGSLMQ